MNINLFDTYNLRARLCVSIFYAAPFIFDIICLTHKAFSITEGFVMSALCVTVCQALLGIHRAPTVGQSSKNPAAELLSPSSELSAGTRIRYYRKLAAFEPEFQPLLDYTCNSLQGSKDDSDINQLCNDAISWLRAKTRNHETFRLVYEENINYGFTRNMLRLKPIFDKLNLLTIFLFCCYIKAIISAFSWTTHGIYCLCLTVHLISMVYLHKCINDSALQKAATRYAYALLETIDIL